MAKTRKCSCGAEISAKGNVTCQQCGRMYKKPFYTKWWFILIVVLFLLIPAGMGGNSKNADPANKSNETESTQANTDQTTTTNTESTNTTSAVDTAVTNLLMDGVYKVGTDIMPGLYKVAVTDNFAGMGYIDRSKDASMEVGSIIANIIIQNQGYVRIKDTDAFVKVQGASLSPYEEKIDIKSTVESGIYLVGVDIAPGTYKVEIVDSVTGIGYVERLADVSMDMKDIIANELFQNQGYVKISKSDFAVRIQGAKLTLEK